jgi:hypothetical protein
MMGAKRLIFRILVMPSSEQPGKLWTTSLHKGLQLFLVLPEPFEGGLGIHELDFIFLDA